jgi:hypothetical protein
MGLFDFFKKSLAAPEEMNQKKGLSIKEAETISREFEKFLTEELPVIKDADLLPYTMHASQHFHADIILILFHAANPLKILSVFLTGKGYSCISF